MIYATLKANKEGVILELFFLCTGYLQLTARGLEALPSPPAPRFSKFAFLGGAMSTTFELTIRPRRGWQAIDFREIFLYRELLAFLVWRDVKIRYRQTLLGGLWAVLQPLTAMLIFAFIFNRVAHVQS